MIAVLDASAAIEIVLQRDAAEKLSEYVVGADWVIAPTLFIAEVTNTFWKYQKIVELPYSVCERHLEQALKLPDDFIGEQDLFREAFKTSCTLNRPVYDILYLIIARRHNGVLLTMDAQLQRKAVKCSIDVLQFLRKREVETVSPKE